MLTYNLSASVEGISGKTWGTGACGIVINNLAARLDTTSARTRVHALLVLAIEVLGAVGANDALGPAVGSRSDEALLAGADGMAVDLPTLTVRTAGRGLARVFISLGWGEVGMISFVHLLGLVVEPTWWG